MNTPPPTPRVRFRQRSLLYQTLVISLVAHVVLILLASPLILSSYIFRRDVAFKPPPKTDRRLEPRKLEFKVRIQEAQKKSGRPQVQPRLTANRLADLSLPDLPLAIAPIRNKALPTLRNFTSSGIGSGIGDGAGNDGLSLGQSAVNFFGVSARGERIVFLLDVSESMLEDRRGGEERFAVVKAEIGRMIQRLSGGTFFNIVAFAHTVDLFRDKLVLASEENKRAAAAWITPYNQGGRIRTVSNNDRPLVDITNTVVAGSGVTRHDLALNYAAGHGADVIFMLTDGEPRLIRKLTPEEWTDWEQKHWTPAVRAKVKREREAYDRALEEENQKRKKIGRAPRHLEYGLPELPYPEMTAGEVINYIKALQSVCYLSAHRKPAQIYIVAYEPEAGAEGLLREMAMENGGRFRILQSDTPLNAK